MHLHAVCGFCGTRIDAARRSRLYFHHWPATVLQGCSGDLLKILSSDSNACRPSFVTPCNHNLTRATLALSSISS